MRTIDNGIWIRLKHIKAGHFRTLFMFMVVMPWALMGRLWGKNVWLISERFDQARDNGYCFYKYVRENYPTQKIIYIIDKSAPDYRKICRYKTVIQHNSWMHYYYYCLSKLHISAHVIGCAPHNSRPFARMLKSILSCHQTLLRN